MSETPQKLRIALLGCGQIADAHLQEIRKVSCAELVGVCDVHQDLADQAAARYEVPRAFSNLDRLVDEAQPDVVHITTPAHTHAPLAIKLLEAGVHVYCEKPFTVDSHEAAEVIAVARRVGRQLCLGHDQLFDPSWVHLKQMIAGGVIGRVTHVKSVLGYPISGNFGRQVSVDPNHWVRRLPGGLFQNTISHPLYRITDFMLDADPLLLAYWYRSEDRDFPTELSVSLRGTEVTGTLLFATNIHAQRITRVYGEHGALEIDPDSQVIRRIGAARLPGAFAKLEMPWKQLTEAAGNLCRNAWRFAKSDIHYFAGMKALFELFYRSLLDGTEPPISYDEMLRVTRMMDNIFAACRAADTRRLGEQGTKTSQRSPLSAVLENVDLSANYIPEGTKS